MKVASVLLALFLLTVAVPCFADGGEPNLGPIYPAAPPGHPTEPLSENLATSEKDPFPLGYPWSTWGAVTYAFPNATGEQGWVLDTYFQQGVDLVYISKPNWILNTFVGFGLTVGSEDQNYWDNKIRPTVGIQVRHPLQPNGGMKWGEIDFGIRGEYWDYIGSKPSSVENAWRAVAFIQWSLGGNWK